MSEWIDKIKNAEVSPPENVWEKVSSSLDESLHGLKFPETIYELETTPPYGAWDKIKTSLEQDEAPVIRMQKQKSSSFLKYAVAACIIGLLAFGAIRFFNIGTDRIDAAAGAGISNSDSQLKANTSASNQTLKSINDSDETDIEKTKGTYAVLDTRTRNLYHLPAQLSNSFSNSFIQKTFQLQYPHRAAVSDISSDNSGERYLMFKNTEGKFVRISKKLSDLFCCVSGEEKDKNCTDQLKKWREKIATSAFVPSPDNFMDILDLVTSLDDTRN
ncbi:MAG: hypothetical protein QM764_24640 [Chitinophagaceae bacterium]